MTIIYSDYATGDDTYGDGTSNNPYKTITEALYYITGGDYLRVGKSPSHTALSGTVSFTNNSTVAATSADLTGSLSAKDFVTIAGTSVQWKEVASVNTTAIIFQSKWWGTTNTYSAIKAGITNVGSRSADNFFELLYNESANSINISGGWDLDSETQTGETFFWQSSADTNALGLYGTNYSRFNVSDIGFMRFNCGFELNECNYFTGNRLKSYSPTGTSNSDGIYLNYQTNSIFSNCDFESYRGFSIFGDASWIKISDCKCYNGTYGIYSYQSDHCQISNYSYYGTGNAFYFEDSGGWNILDSELSNTAIKVDPSSEPNYFRDCTGWAGIVARGYDTELYPFAIYHGTLGDRTYFSNNNYYYRNDSEGVGGTKCLSVAPNSNTIAVPIIIRFPCDSGEPLAFLMQMKSRSSWDGEIRAELWYKGKYLADAMVDYDATYQCIRLIPTTSYKSFAISLPGSHCDRDSIIELRLMVYGTTGEIDIDDIKRDKNCYTDFTVDSQIGNPDTLTFTLDQMIASYATKALTIDSYIAITQLETLSIDSHIASYITNTFDIDEYIFVTNTNTFTVDKLIATTIEDTFSIDEYIMLEMLKTFAIDSHLSSYTTKTFTIDKYLAAIIESPFTMDSHLASITEEIFEIDSHLATQTEIILTLDSMLAAITEGIFTIDEIITLLDILKEFTLDSHIALITEATLTVDENIATITEGTFEVDSHIATVTEIEITIDENIAKETTKTFTINSRIGKFGKLDFSDETNSNLITII